MPKLTYADREEIELALDRQMKPLEECMAKNMREFNARREAEQRAAVESKKRRVRDLKALIAAVKLNGQLMAHPEKLSALLALPVTSQAGLLSVLEPERQNLVANGIHFFPLSGSTAITFRLL